MQIVIEISEDYYNILKYEVEHGNDYVPIKLIANGTPLPPHGDLIDRDDLLKYKRHFEDFDGDFMDIIHEESVLNAPTIIEADEESEDK